MQNTAAVTVRLTPGGAVVTAVEADNIREQRVAARVIDYLGDELARLDELVKSAPWRADRRGPQPPLRAA